MTSSVEVGRVVALWRYPVKSMAGEPLRAADVSWHGLAGDRRWAFVRTGQVRSGFPWMTIRQRADMLHYRPSFADPDRPDDSSVLVRTPAGTEFEVTDQQLAAELGHGSRPIKQDRGVFDDMPLSLISTQSIAALGALVGAELDRRRFRPNLLVQTAGSEPFAEESWIGAVLQIGAVRMRVDLRDVRCAVIGVDPVTAVRNPAVLKRLGRERETCLGVYGSTVQPGRVAVGDAVSLVPG